MGLFGSPSGNSLIFVVVWIWVLYSCYDVVLVLVDLSDVEISDLSYEFFLCWQIRYSLLIWSIGLIYFSLRLYFSKLLEFGHHYYYL